jgi:hypothetical protein
MTTRTHPVITRPDVHPAKNVRRAGALNHHHNSGSGEILMVNTTTPAVDTTTGVDLAEAVYRRINGSMGRFLRTSLDGEVVYSPHALAELVVEILTGHTAALAAERDGLARESDLREREILDLIDERDRLAARLSTLDTTAAPVGGGRG